MALVNLKDCRERTLYIERYFPPIARSAIPMQCRPCGFSTKICIALAKSRILCMPTQMVLTAGIVNRSRDKASMSNLSALSQLNPRRWWQLGTGV